MRDAVIDKKAGGWLSCGPVAVAALVGAPLSYVEALFRWEGLGDGVQTRASDLDHVLRNHFNLSLSLGYIADWGREESLWWVLRFCPEDKPLIISIQFESDRHWVAVHSGWLADVHTHGRWIEWDDYGLHANCKVETVWVVLGR
jgi:hypothetical protein